MDSFLLFFETMPTWQKLAWVVTCLVVCWVLEGNYPLARFLFVYVNKAPGKSLDRLTAESEFLEHLAVVAVDVLIKTNAPVVHDGAGPVHL